MKIVQFITIAGFSLIWQIMPATAQHSLFQDRKANQVGDIITVILTENISGSSSSDARNSSNANGSASGTASGNFIPFEPTFGTGATVEYGSDERNLASQGQLLEGNMSVQ
ncbi:MAG: flagellar basal body L-ring protein FlgH, partial [Balneolaceae bacterium]